MHRRGDDRRRLGAAQGARRREPRVPLLATNDVLYDAPEQRDLQDVLTCIREGVTIERAGRRLEANAERHLKPARRDGAAVPRCAGGDRGDAAICSAASISSSSELRYEYPDEPVPPGWTPQDWLEELTWRRRAQMRYPDGVPDKVADAARRGARADRASSNTPTIS